jgi:hypothetical protein
MTDTARHPQAGPPHRTGDAKRFPVRSRMMAVFAVFAAAGCGSDPPRPPNLELTETYSRVVPPSVFIEGVAAGADRGVAVWTPRVPELMYNAGSGWARWTDPALLRPVAVSLDVRPGAGNVVAEVLDGESGAVLQLDSTGHAVGRRLIRQFSHAADAVRSEGGWFALVSADDSSRTLRYAADGEEAARTLYRVPSSRTQAAKDVRLSPWGSDVIVTDSHSPFTSLLVRASGAVEPLLTPPPLPELKRRRVRWISLPVLPVEGGFLQEIADGTSDRRLLILYDSAGTVLRSTSLTAPLALVSASGERNVLLGIRRAGPTEVVGYRWSWVR